jgi:hypothetical protein
MMNDTVITEDQEKPDQSSERKARILDAVPGRRISSGPAAVEVPSTSMTKIDLE